ncbi:hypothetical protein BCR33DRAFT_714977 [Rhizoclosmatium globosum]|uniref:Postreplication repair E3 ubiquitin-protein ligase RAD18 n=1 Tax=Rhizoclosmatium globosum TaxID=329046 RepID=A0A1Y2CJI6_9FUNG|nr:hypothetical protein BCR33DRAFT_714977 [Rhizoclosmatium globosum]|eukprot:ORY47210.1 hypothetical protein BCR33DRAFT_714977 [Rhizoclosmatium globosum]
MEATPTPSPVRQFVEVSEALLTCDVCAELLRGSAVLPCRHVFCSECIRRHLQDNRDCPSCRVSIKNGMVDVRFCLVLDALADNLRTNRDKIQLAVDAAEKKPSTSKTNMDTVVHGKGKKRAIAKKTVASNALEVACQTSPVKAQSPSLDSESRKRPRIASSSSCPTSTSATTSRPPAVINDVNGGDAGRLEVFGDADAFFPCPICSQCVKNRNMDAHISSDCQVHIELNPNSGPSVYALHSIQSSSPLYLNDCKEVVGRNSEKSGSASITSVEVKSTKTIIIDHGSSPIILSKSNSQLMEDADSIDDEFGDVVFSTPVKPTRTTSGISIEDVETTDDESDFQDFIPRKSIRSKRHKSLEPELVVDPVEVSTTSKTMGTSNSLNAKKHGVARHSILANIMPSKQPDSRKPKPAVAYDTLKDAQLRKLLKDEGLRTTGDKATLKKRHKEYTLLHNANLDTLNPLPQSQILAKMLVWEQTHGELSGGRGNVAAGMGAVAAFHGHAVSKEGTERDVKHMTKYADEFRSLIEGMKERRRLKREEREKEAERERQTRGEDDGEMVEDDTDDDGVR